MTYERLFKEFASALVRGDRKRGAELVGRVQSEAESMACLCDVDPYFTECAELKRQRDELRKLTPQLSAKLDQQFDQALGDLTTRALEELGFGEHPTL